MPETVVEAIKQVPQGNIVEYLGVRSDDLLLEGPSAQLAAIKSIFAASEIDEETAVGVIRSFESKAAPSDTLHERLGRLEEFLRSLKVQGRQAFLDTIKKLGYYSKSELEEYARETGDWSHFLKRAGKNKG